MTSLNDLLAKVEALSPFTRQLGSGGDGQIASQTTLLALNAAIVARATLGAALRWWPRVSHVAAVG
jgi:hypothetical protein